MDGVLIVIYGGGDGGGGALSDLSYFLALQAPRGQRGGTEGRGRRKREVGHHVCHRLVGVPFTARYGVRVRGPPVPGRSSICLAGTYATSFNAKCHAAWGKWPSGPTAPPYRGVSPCLLPVWDVGTGDQT